MKKLIISLVIIVVGYMSHAAYLYWQLSTDNTGLTESSGTYSYNGKTVTGARVVAISGATSEGDAPYTSGGVALSTYDTNYSTTTALGNPVGVATAVNSDNLYADLRTYTTGFTYYIELMSDNLVVGISEGITYASNLSNISTSLGGDMLSGGSLAVWHGGSTYSVPEPTGAMLMIFGLAMLGLKRRKA